MTGVLALDIGTSAVKGVLFDIRGEVRATAQEEYALHTPAPDVVELDPGVYWEKTRRVIGRILSAPGVRPGDIRSVGVTSQGESLVVLDGGRAPLRPVLVWLDNRARAETEEIARRFDTATVYRVTGQNEILPTWTAAKLLWLRRREPEVFRRARMFLMVEDLLLYRLTGRFITDRALNPSTLYFDITTGEWWGEMLDFLGLSERLLPELRWSGEESLPLLPAAAAATGLHPETRVTTAPIDQVAGTVGAGNLEESAVTESTGSALAICATSPRPLYDPRRRAPCQLHGARGRYVLMPWVHTGGMVLQWFRDRLGCGLDYDLLAGEAAGVAPGAEGLVFLPHLAGAGCPVMNPRARGVFFGMDLHHRRAHFVRAVLESVAFVLKQNLEFLASLGLRPGEIRSLGGGARSDLWLQIKADVLGLPVTSMACEESTCLGAAMLSCVATGVYPDLHAAAAAMVRARRRVEPRPGQAEAYGEAYRRYLELDGDLQVLFGRQGRDDAAREATTPF
ncbi:MAG: xylulokinase [Spirochaetota bacterium]